MALKKTIASYRGENGEIVPQRDVEMHPLEEAEMLAHWAIHDEVIKCPPKPSAQDEHEWLIIHGEDYVKQKRDEWQKSFDANQPAVEEANKKFQEAHQAWCDHCDHCVANGFDPDTHDKEKYNAA
jgi:hypothetical protein